MLLRSQIKSNQDKTHKRVKIEEITSMKQLQCVSHRPISNQPPKIYVDFHRITNDGTRPTFKKLIQLKCIISRQLPKMPRQYIVKVLFDGKHESIIIEATDQRMLGGMCFRCFEEQNFVEVVFLAMDKTYKDRKYGTRLMDNLKEMMQQRNKTILLTYADNTAIGFFKKQGFQVTIDTPQKCWHGFIKMYAGGTLMECKIHHNIKYTKFRESVFEQKRKFIDFLKLKMRNQYKYSGALLQKIKQNKNASIKMNFSLINESNFPIQLIPGVLQSKWCGSLQHQLQNTPEITFMLQMLHVIECIRKFDCSSIFLGLSPLPFLPKYASKILLDLPTIQKKIISRKCYFMVSDLRQDLIFMIQQYQNCLQADSLQFQKTQELLQKMEPILQSLADRKIQIHINTFFKQENIGKNKRNKCIKIK